jgi:hypothetical protein
MIFKRIIIKCWNDIDKKVIDNTIDSMPNRIKDVIENNGMPINY